MENHKRWVFSPDKTNDWIPFLKQHGYVLLKGVVSSNNVETAKNYLWNWLETLGSGINRTDPKTWVNENWPGAISSGFTTAHGGGQIQAAWYLRSLPSVKNAFAAIWGTQDLAVSMDTFILWRPWWNNFENALTWKPHTGPMHCDQNPYDKPGFQCVQGMIPLRPVNEESGGLQIAPGTHSENTQDYMREAYPHLKTSGLDWCVLRSEDDLGHYPQFIEADPGDLILWDSRTIHGGVVGKGGKEDLNDLVRASLTVCMLPKSTVPENVAKDRREAWKRGWTLTHWPNDVKLNNPYTSNSGQNIPRREYEPIELTTEQLELLG